MINSQATQAFSILHGVKQGCLLVLYLFLLVGEALNIAAKVEQRTGRIIGIHLPNNSEQ